MKYESMRRLGDPRWYVRKGEIYVVRDVWKRGKFQKELDRCEYAVYEDNKLKWTACKEGVRFDDIKPIGRCEC